MKYTSDLSERLCIYRNKGAHLAWNLPRPHFRYHLPLHSVYFFSAKNFSERESVNIRFWYEADIQ